MHSLIVFLTILVVLPLLAGLAMLLAALADKYMPYSLILLWVGIAGWFTYMYTLNGG